jgi:ATP-dependent DNA helicase RecQ
MREPFDELQVLILSDKPDHAGFRNALTALQAEFSGTTLARSRALNRLSLAMQEVENALVAADDIDQVGTADVCVLLRQVIRAYNCKLKVKARLWGVLSSRESDTGLRVTHRDTDGTVTLTADDWKPRWLLGAGAIDRLESRRDDSPTVGDGLLYTATGFTTYQSDAQKAAVTAALYTGLGSTLLVTLPTGGGKSLCTILPAFQESSGGRAPGGTTLVIVPTVALALDQERQARAHFARSGTSGPEYTPSSYTSATPGDVRNTILNGLRRGTLPLLYTSPEAISNTYLGRTVLECAEVGTLRRLVVDEVHLVETWGAGFRTEFQFLASLRRKMLAASGGALKTLLLSATVAPHTEQLLRHWFSEGSNFESVRGDRLRPEPSYWFAHSDTEETRQRHVLDALHYLPRPAILYVTKPDDAEAWRAKLRREGFVRTATFSGRTEGEERERLVNAWRENRIDVMVATSAFGVGVDKSDVRTIIHACLSENVDRFYQEVGRGGRDGCSSISLLCLSRADVDVAFGMNKAARIRTDTAENRWRGLVRASKRVGSNQLLLDMDARPGSNPEMAVSELNRGWNEHVVLLMERARLLQVLDTVDSSAENTVGQAAGADGSPPWLKVRLLDTAITHNVERFRGAFEPIRENELQRVRASLDSVVALVHRYSHALATRCIAHDFEDVYEGVSLACGGCAYCRANGIKPYSRAIVVTTDLQDPPPSQGYLKATLSQRLGVNRTLILLSDDYPQADVVKKHIYLLTALVGAGVQQLLLPDSALEDSQWSANLVRMLGDESSVPHLVLAHSYVVDNPDRPLYPIPTLAVYPEDPATADEFHVALMERRKGSFACSPLIYLIKRGLYLLSKSGEFTQKVDGMEMDAGRLEEILRTNSETLLC